MGSWDEQRNFLFLATINNAINVGSLKIRYIAMKEETKQLEHLNGFIMRDVCTTRLNFSEGWMFLFFRRFF